MPDTPSSKQESEEPELGQLWDNDLRTRPRRRSDRGLVSRIRAPDSCTTPVGDSPCGRSHLIGEQPEL